MQIEIDETPAVEDVRELLHEYPASIPVPLEVEDFEGWLATLPGPYAPPLGRSLVARCDGMLAGCVLLRPIDDEAGEVKRLYVREEFRGLGVARALVEALLEASRTAGYALLRLDTHESMIPAQNLYRSYGFREIPPYWDHPVPGVVFFELEL